MPSSDIASPIALIFIYISIISRIAVRANLRAKMHIIKEKIVKLQQEADQLVKQRDGLYKTIGDIEVRLHQIVGAVNELNNIIQEQEKEDGSNKDNKGS